jgi:hypothetical protein
MKDLEILKRLIAEAEEESVETTIDSETTQVKEKPKNAAFEKDPMGFILKKYHSLNEIMTELMTKDFREFVDAIFYIAPKPTTFKIQLHNGQSFFMTYMKENIYEAIISGKRYYLAGIGEKERCMMAIARLLRFGTPLKTKGAEGAEEGTRDGENTGMEGDWAAKGGATGGISPDTGAEEAPAEEGGEELAENKRILENILKKSIVTELTITPDYKTKKGPNPYYTVNSDTDEKIKSALKLSGELVYKSISDIPSGKKDSYSDAKGAYEFEVMTVNDEGKLSSTKKYVRLAKKSVTGHYGEKSTGSGGGAAQTALQESSQCLVNAIRYNKGSEITEKDLNEKNFAKATKRIETTSSLEEMVSFIQGNASWRTSLISTANALAKQFPGNFKFYRGQGVATAVDQAAKSCLKYVIGNLNINKWNPADIWMASDNLDIDSIPQNTEIPKLNKWMKAKYKSKELIGVSLKKCGEDCKLTVYNLKEIERPEKFEGLGPKDTNFFKSLDIYIKYTDGLIQFRNFSNITSWQGEIKSKTAAGGKIGGGGVSMVVSLQGKQDSLPQQSEVLAACKSADEQTASDLYKKYKTISLLKSKMKEDEFIETFLSAPLSSKTSNYMNIELLNRLSKMSEEEKDKFVQGLISYAKSETNVSSVFVKAS